MTAILRRPDPFVKSNFRRVREPSRGNIVSQGALEHALRRPYFLATPESRAAFATAEATAGPTRLSKAFAMM